MEKVILISINSVTENTGGGIYLRSLISLYKHCNYDLDVISKKDEVNDSVYQKNILSDFLSRLLLSPSFLAIYFFRILKQVKKNDIVAIHSSRLGFYAWLLKKIFPNKTVIMHLDKVESMLIKQNNIKDKFFKKVLSMIDTFLIPYSEKLCCKYADKMTFITKQDMKDFNLLFNYDFNRQYIIPVYLDLKNKIIPKTNGQRNDNRLTVIFTGSFDFYPNQDAYKTLLDISFKLEDVNFIVAGRKLGDFISEMELKKTDNIKIVSDPSSEELKELFYISDVFLCPVKLGSGMKTKIAEALSYNLYVFAHENSINGYEDAIEMGAVIAVPEVNFCEDIVKYINKFKMKKNENRFFDNPLTPKDAFEEYYSLVNGIQRFKEVVML